MSRFASLRLVITITIIFVYIPCKNNLFLIILEILNQINNITATVASDESQHKCANHSKVTSNKSFEDIDISNQELFEDCTSTSNISNVTQPSDFTTLERINDLDLVESKLSSLKANSDFETHL